MSTPFAILIDFAVGVRGLWTALVHTVLTSRLAPPAARHTAASPAPTPTGSTSEPCASALALAPPQSLTHLPVSSPPLPSTQPPPPPSAQSASEDQDQDLDVDIDVVEITPPLPVSSPPLPTPSSESEDQGVDVEVDVDVDEITPAMPVSSPPLTSAQPPPPTSAPSESEVADVEVDEITPVHPTTPTPHPPSPPPAPQTREARLYTVNPPPLDAPLPMYVRRPRPSASPRVTRARHCDFANQNLELWNFVMRLEGQIPGLPCPQRANPQPYPEKPFSRMPLGVMGTVPRRRLTPGSGRGNQKTGRVEEPLAATLVGDKIPARRSKKITKLDDEGAITAPRPAAEEVQSAHKPSGGEVLEKSVPLKEDTLITAVHSGTEVVGSALRPSAIRVVKKKVRFQVDQAVTAARPATEVHRLPVRGILKKRVTFDEDSLATAVHPDTEAVEPACRPMEKVRLQDSVSEAVQSEHWTSAIRAVKRVTFQDEAPTTGPPPVPRAVHCPEKAAKKRPVTLRELVEQIEQAEAATPPVTTHNTTRRPPSAARAARDAGAPSAHSNTHAEGRRTRNWARRVRDRVMQAAHHQRDRSARVVQRVRDHFAVPTFILQEREPCAA